MNEDAPAPVLSPAAPSPGAPARTLTARRVGEMLAPPVSKRTVHDWATRGSGGKTLPHDVVRVGQQDEKRFSLEEVLAWCAAAGMKYTRPIFEVQASGTGHQAPVKEPGSESRATTDLPLATGHSPLAPPPPGPASDHLAMFESALEQARSLLSQMQADPALRTAHAAGQLSTLLKNLGVELDRVREMRREDEDRRKVVMPRTLAGRVLTALAETFASALGGLQQDAPAVVREGLAAADVVDLSDPERFDRAVYAAVERKIRSMRAALSDQALRAADELDGGEGGEGTQRARRSAEGLGGGAGGKEAA